jgi:hypothetical protein
MEAEKILRGLGIGLDVGIVGEAIISVWLK